MTSQQTVDLDPRRHAFRPDLADEQLKTRVAAERYVTGRPAQVVRPAVPLRGTPDPRASLATEALFGEQVLVFDEAEGWAWVQLKQDGYVGYLPASALSFDVAAATHRVKVPGTFLYPAADMKSPPLMHLSLNAELAITEDADDYARTSSGAFVYKRHIRPVGEWQRDYVDVAERLLDTPYLWGGKTRLGLDCSALVQLALQAAGVSAPRDSDMQRAEIGTAIEIPEDLEGLQRGDLVFWPGHVGIMTDGVMLLHANAHHMAVVVETLPEAAERIAKHVGPIAAIKRVANVTSSVAATPAQSSIPA